MPEPNRQFATAEREERRRMMEELEAAGEGVADIGFHQYAIEMRTLDRMLEEYGATDEFGVPKPMTAEMKAALTAQIRRVAKTGEDYLEWAGENRNKGLAGVVGKLQGMLSRDLTVIEEADPETGKSLPELFAESRVRTVELGDRQVEELTGSSQSYRIPMTLMSNGRPRPGFFTPAAYVKPQVQFFEAVEDAVRDLSMPPEEKKKMRTLLRGAFEGYKAARLKKEPGLAERSDDFFYREMIRDLSGGAVRGQAFSEEDGKALRKRLEEFGVNTITVGTDVINAFGKQLTRANTSLSLAETTGLRVGDRLDSRNSAMSAVAGLFGRSNLLARSTAMRCRGPQGMVAEGTFTDKAQGYDLDGSPDDYQHLCDEPFEGGSGAFLRQLADIQVLDYICGNVDRHFGNMVYQTDENGRLSGVQGFDHENAFGRFADGKGRVNMTGPADMNVISASMAKKIKEMDPAMLKFTLRGRGLSEEEMNFSVQRLQDMKEAIAKGEAYYSRPVNRIKGEFAPVKRGYLRVVPDKDFKHYHISDLHVLDKKNSKKDQVNIFSRVEQAINSDLEKYRKMGFLYEPDNHMESPFRRDGAKEAFVGDAQTVRAFTRPLRGADRLVRETGFNVDELTHGRNGSKKFADMVSAAKDLEKLQKAYTELAKRREVMSETEYMRGLTLLDQGLSKLETANDAYLAHKMKQRGAENVWLIKPKNDYERHRVEYAMKVRTFCEEARKQFPKADLSEEARREFNAAGELAEMADRKAAMEAVRKLHEQTGMASPEELKKAGGAALESAAKSALSRQKGEGNPQMPGPLGPGL